MPITDFTYNAYSKFILYIAENGYTFANYHDYEKVSNPCILCHDVDYDMKKALKLAKIETDILSVHSTYFVMLNTNFYNLFSSSIIAMVKEIISGGHEIGLHFDEACYPLSPSIIESIQKEKTLLEQIIDYPIKTVSMHRPSQFTIDSNIIIPSVVNRYSQTFFNDFKYVSDSRHNWREDAETIVSSKMYDKLHILTHPFWYTEEKKSCRDKLLFFIIAANRERYRDLNTNFRDLDEFVHQEDIIQEE